MASLLPNAKTQFIDANGRPLVGGKVYSYFVSTETEKDTFQDPALSIPNTNPIILDSYGEASIWGTGAYRQVLKDKDDQLIWDQVTQESGTAVAGSFRDEVFVAGTDFTPGTTDHLTLSQAYGSIDNIDVHFDAAYQGPDQILSLADDLLTFTAPIPEGVERVYVKGGLTIPITKPSTGSVGDDEIAKGSKADYRNSQTFDVREYGARGDVSLNSSGALVSGTNDTISINYALSAAKNAGGGVVTGDPSKLYLVKGSLNVYDNVTLRDIRIFYDKPQNPSYEHCIVLYGTNSNAIGVQVVSDPAYVRGDSGFGILAAGVDNKIWRSLFENIPSAAIWTNDASGTSIIGNRVKSPKADGIHIADSGADFVVGYNILTGCGDDSIAVGGNVAPAAQPRDGLIIGNKVDGSTQGNGIALINGVKLAAVGNNISNVAAAGIALYEYGGETRMSSSILIEGNYCCNCGSAPRHELESCGIMLGWANGVSLKGNHIDGIIAPPAGSNWPTAGIVLFNWIDVLIDGNDIRNIPDHGIYRPASADTQGSTQNSKLRMLRNDFMNVEREAIKVTSTTAAIDTILASMNTFNLCAYLGDVLHLVELGGTGASPLRFYNNIDFDFAKPVLLASANASNIDQSGNVVQSVVNA